MNLPRWLIILLIVLALLWLAVSLGAWTLISKH
jgi:hypothetical protein